MGRQKLAPDAAGVALERQLTKDEILSLYVTIGTLWRQYRKGCALQVFFFFLVWFGKETARPDTGAISMLIALPQSPAARRSGSLHRKAALPPRTDSGIAFPPRRASA